MKLFTLNQAQWDELVDSISAWLEKMSVGIMVVGLFQKDFRVAGIAGGLGCFIVSMAIKLWRKRK